MPEGGGLSVAEQEFWSLKHGVYAGFEYIQQSPYFSPEVSVPLGDIYSTIAAGIGAQTAITVPDIHPTVTVTPPVVSPPPSPGPPAVFSPVIDPEAATDVTVFEEEVAARGPVDPKPTDWGTFYDEFIILNPEVPVPVFQEPVLPGPPERQSAGTGTAKPKGEEDVSIWTDIAEGAARAIFPLPSAAIDLWTGYGSPGFVAGPPAAAGPPANVVPIGGGMQNAPAATCPPSGPKYAKVCLATGAVMPLRQRRRRRLLTSSDLSDLAALKALFGNSAGVQAALVKAVRR